MEPNMNFFTEVMRKPYKYDNNISSMAAGCC